MSKYSFELNGNTIEYTIKDKVTFEESVEAYNRTIQCMFPDVPDDVKNDVEIVYVPYMGDIGRCFAIMTLFTDIDFSELDNEDVWYISQYTDVMANIISEDRLVVIKRIDYWIDKFAEDYKSRILSRRKVDQLVDALSMVASPNGAFIDTDGANELLSKIKGMSGEDIVNAITSNK